MAHLAIVAGYLVGNPVGGHVMSILHWLAGLRALGYDVVFVEHHGWPDACWNPETKQLSDDASFGMKELADHAKQLGLHGWCFVDAQGTYHGLSQAEIAALCASYPQIGAGITGADDELIVHGALREALGA